MRLRERMSDILTGGLASRSRSWAPPTLPPLTEAAPARTMDHTLADVVYDFVI